jgi:hypothetical protein
MERQITKLLNNGWIGESWSRFAATIIFIKKSNGTLRYASTTAHCIKLRQRTGPASPTLMTCLCDWIGLHTFQNLILYQVITNCASTKQINTKRHV